MSNRQPARRGLSYFDANSGRLVTEGPDVLDIKAEITARWPDVIEVFFDIEALEWVIVEKCKDGVERLAFTTPTLNQRVIDKLNRIDQTAHAQPDMLAKLESEERDEERKDEQRIEEAFGEQHERLLSALRKDGVGGIPKVFFSGKAA